MKKLIVAICALVLALSLCSCKDTSRIDRLISSSDTNINTTSGIDTTTIPEIEGPISSDANSNDSLAIDSIITSNSENSSQNAEFDIDLTLLDTSMMYAQVYDMLNNPNNYNGKTVKAQGSFSYYKDPETNNEYFAVLISDITACCAQGIEFRLDGNYSYPTDYPPLETEIIITGICDVYKEGTYTYLQLLNADYKIA